MNYGIIVPDDRRCHLQTFNSGQRALPEAREVVEMDGGAGTKWEVGEVGGNFFLTAHRAGSSDSARNGKRPLMEGGERESWAHLQE